MSQSEDQGKIEWCDWHLGDGIISPTVLVRTVQYSNLILEYRIHSRQCSDAVMQLNNERNIKDSREL